MGVSYEALDAPEFDSAFENALPLLDADTAAPAANISASTSCEPPDPSLFVEDASFTNGSSIALLLEWRGLRCLFLGDSWPSVVAEEWGRLPGGLGPLDLVKVSHHGSSYNSSPDLAKRLSAKRYVFSSDGTKHGHPNLDAALWVADGGQPGASLVFNYPSSTAARLSMPDAIKRFGHVVTVGSGAEIVSIAMEAGAGREQPEA